MAHSSVLIWDWELLSRWHHQSLCNSQCHLLYVQSCVNMGLETAQQVAPSVAAQLENTLPLKVSLCSRVHSKKPLRWRKLHMQSVQKHEKPPSLTQLWVTTDNNHSVLYCWKFTQWCINSWTNMQNSCKHLCYVYKLVKILLPSLMSFK